jgi:hypothetical protein
VPTLSAGKHRNPRKGACFMEMASFLAGDRWSDHPSCTHPLLAELALMVNDNVSDDSRQRLLPLVPSVIGLTSDDPHVDPRLALFAACTALPVAAEPAQRALAVAVLTCNRVLESLDGQPPDTVDAQSQQALESVPLAATWAGRFSHGLVPSPRAFRRHAAASIVRLSVKGISAAAIPEPDEMLCDLLAGAIDRFPDWAGTVPVANPGAAPAPDTSPTTASCTDAKSVPA